MALTSLRVTNMRIPRLFTEQNLISGTCIKLDKNASSYLLKVLRLQLGAELHLFNGAEVNGTFGYFTAVITNASKQAEVSINNFIAEANQSPLHISLYQGISKGDHMDITIQKAVELGVNEIFPVICERTVVNLKADRLDKKMRHWNGIVQSSCEQSGRNKLLKIHQPIKYNQVQLAEKQTGIILQPESSQSLFEIERTESVALLIGPEGGFSDDEITQAVSKSFTAVKFGPRILRTETAAIAAISIFQSAWGDLN